MKALNIRVIWSIFKKLASGEILLTVSKIRDVSVILETIGK